MKLITLTEQMDDLTSTRDLIDAIRNSSQFFKSRYNESQWLYRGVDSEQIPRDALITTITPRKDRKPLSMQPALHDALNVEMKRQFGIPYRSEGVFVTGNRSDASSYGPVAIILPESPFKFCWSPRIHDAYSVFELSAALRYVRTNAVKKQHSSDEVPQTIIQNQFTDFLDDNAWGMELFYEWFNEEYHNGEYTDEDLGVAIESEHEIMISCPRYVVINPNESIDPSYVNAAEHILGGPLEVHSSPNIKAFINAIANKVVQ